MHFLVNFDVHSEIHSEGMGLDKVLGWILHKMSTIKLDNEHIKNK